MIPIQTRANVMLPLIHDTPPLNNIHSKNNCRHMTVKFSSIAPRVNECWARVRETAQLRFNVTVAAAVRNAAASTSKMLPAVSSSSLPCVSTRHTREQHSAPRDNINSCQRCYFETTRVYGPLKVGNQISPRKTPACLPPPPHPPFPTAIACAKSEEIVTPSSDHPN